MKTMTFDKPDCKAWNIHHRGIFAVIKLHSEGKNYTPSSKGIWCSYIHIPEHLTPAKLFEEIWLDEQVTRFTSESPWRVTHNYYDCKHLMNIPLHGRITYYAKHGHSAGHRSVEVGCDWSHLWDHESGFATIKEVHADLTRAIDYWLDQVVKTYETK